MKRFCLLVIGAMLLSLPAYAHAFLEDASPKVGSTITVTPKEIRLTYTQAIETVFSHIVLLDQTGKIIETTAMAPDSDHHNILAVSVPASLMPGTYEVLWDVVSIDTHKTNGHFTFEYQP